MKFNYTTVDLAILAVVAALFGAVFAFAWTPYYAIKAIGGKPAAVLLTYGIWYMAAPLTATLLKKPGSAVLGETLAGLVESLIPQIGGSSSLIYAFFQGLFSEAVYALGKYRSFGSLQAVLAGAVPAIPSILLDIFIWKSIYPLEVFTILTVLAMASGAIYGFIAYKIAERTR
ncbi:MAG: ABC transporter permease [Thermoprotei archaeon]|nr:MAG: ABC transporter permease [Thermoprotei archaeon]